MLFQNDSVLIGFVNVGFLFRSHTW